MGGAKCTARTARRRTPLPYTTNVWQFLLDGCFGEKLKNDGKHKFEDMLDENIDYENLLLFLLAEEDIDEEYFSLN
jgi:hypothetical protein